MCKLYTNWKLVQLLPGAVLSTCFGRWWYVRTDTYSTGMVLDNYSIFVGYRAAVVSKIEIVCSCNCCLNSVLFSQKAQVQGVGKSCKFSIPQLRLLDWTTSNDFYSQCLVRTFLLLNFFINFDSINCVIDIDHNKSSLSFLQYRFNGAETVDLRGVFQKPILALLLEIHWGVIRY